MAGIFDKTRDLLKQLQSRATSVVQSNTQFKPGSFTYNNILTPAAKAQQFVQSPPQFQFQPSQNPITKVGQGFAEGIINQPLLSLQAASRIGTDIREKTMTPQRFIGNAAEASMLPLMFVGGAGAGKTIAGQILKPTLKQAVKTGAIQGAGYGAGFGLLQGLNENQNASSVTTQFIHSIPQTLMGAGLGAITGGVAGGAVNLPKATVLAAIKKLRPNATVKQASIMADNYLLRNRDLKTGQFAKDKLQWAGQLTPVMQRKLDASKLNPDKWPTKSTPKINAEIDAYLKEKIPPVGLSVKYTKSPRSLQPLAEEARKFGFNKMPWEMTKQEWNQAFDKTKVNFSGTGGQLEGGMGNSKVNFGGNMVEKQNFLKMGLNDQNLEGLQIPARHYQVVQEAIKRGLPVPANVLKEYPELSQVIKQLTKTELSKSGTLSKNISQPNYTTSPLEGAKVAEEARGVKKVLSDAEKQLIKDYPRKLGPEEWNVLSTKLSPQGISNLQTKIESAYLKAEGGVKGEISKNIAQPLEQIPKGVQPTALNIQKSPAIKTLPVSKSGNLGDVSGISGQKPPAGSSPTIIPQGNKYVFNINKQRLALNPSEKQTLDTAVNTIKPELQSIKGKVLSNKEVIGAAKTSDILRSVTTREETLQAEAATLKARQRLVELDKSIGQLSKQGNTAQLQVQMKDLIDSLRVVSANAADTGRKLQSLSIEAGDESIRMQVLKDITRTNTSTDDILKAAANVDWNDANSITKFYRQFIKPTTMEILDEYRYNNMLSNPKTHIRNAFSNMLQTFVTRPLTLTAEGRPAEALKYLSGASKNFPTAVDEFVKSFKGQTVLQKPDLEHIPTNKLPKFLTVPTRLMEAGDKFFTALIKGGELARGATPEQAAKTAEYSLFRQGLHPEGQGTVLNAIDSVTAWTYKAPKAVRWFVPFIRTPMNFAKQWVEYSPAGFSTVIGAGNKREQLAKAMLGSAVTAIGAQLAMADRTTWAAPTDPKEKELFYASGKKPFSILVGDKWVPMMTAGPFAFALALPAASKFYQEDNRTALTDSGLNKLTKTVTSMAQFLSGQTFLEGIGNFVKFASGDADYSIGNNLAFTAGQVVPMQGLLRYISTVMDPIYRKPKGFGESFLKDIPGFSQGLQAYTDPTGQPSKRLGVNYVTPYDVGQQDSTYEPGLQTRNQQLQMNAKFNEALKPYTEVDSQIKDLMKQGDKQTATQLIKQNQDMLIQGKTTKQFKTEFDKLYKDLATAQALRGVDPQKQAQLVTAIQKRIDLLNQAYANFQNSTK